MGQRPVSDRDIAAPAPAPCSTGFALPALRRHVTQSMIDAYGRASGDLNPIHVDPDYARAGPFGRTIAHGMMTLSFAAQMLNAWSERRFDVDGEIDVAFIGPVFAGDDVEITGIVEGTVEREMRAAVRIGIGCKVGDRAVLAGVAHLFCSDGEER